MKEVFAKAVGAAIFSLIIVIFVSVYESLKKKEKPRKAKKIKAENQTISNDKDSDIRSETHSDTEIYDYLQTLPQEDTEQQSGTCSICGTATFPVDNLVCGMCCALLSKISPSNRKTTITRWLKNLGCNHDEQKIQALYEWTNNHIKELPKELLKFAQVSWKDDIKEMKANPSHYKPKTRRLNPETHAWEICD